MKQIGMPRRRSKVECQFCRGKMVIIRGGGEGKKYSCPRCKTVIFERSVYQPICPECDSRAWKITTSDDGLELFFIHDIKEENGEMVDYGHRVKISDLPGGLWGL